MDWDQIVTLQTSQPQVDEFNDGRSMWVETVGSYPIWEAVALVMRQWAPQSRRRRAARLVLQNGEVWDIGKIEELAMRSDFPDRVGNG